MDHTRCAGLALALFAAAFAPVLASGTAAAGDAAVIAEATGGTLNSRQGQYADPDCGLTQYEADVVDLNGDGQPEVFTQIFGTCQGGGTGVLMNLYIKGGDGRWQPQFGFPGIYRVLETRDKGYPDIEIGGTGTCFPLWRWTGQQYALFKKCAR
jgi:hypothetical protein